MKIVADGNIPFVEKCFSSIGDVTIVGGRQITPEVVKDADILLVRSVTKVNKDLLAGSQIKFVATATIGFEHVDVEHLRKQNIGFASAPGSNANSVAEYVTAGLLSVAKKNNIILEGKSIGIIGVGNVGSKVATKTAAMGMKVFLNDPPLQRSTGDKKYVPLEELLGCDFITFHTPLTFDGIDKTYHLADEKFFKSLKAGCIFFNTSRGGVNETAVLKNALKEGRFGGVVLDVWENEPNIDIELLEMVDIVTPHIAGYSYDGKVAGMIMIYNAACKYFGLEPKFEIESFLPKPVIPEIKINQDFDKEENILRETVEKIYNMSEDDGRMREILKKKSDERGKYFDQLRKEYPVRREFQNTEIILNKPDETLARKLSGIGFKI
jgi:erythronate-4-phosphate dehydrogenase